MSDAQVNFVRQQGFASASPHTCGVQYPALMFQPRIIGMLVLAGVILQSPLLFLSVSAVLWWSALVPGLNPFEALYNALVARPKGRPLLTAAPAPRRFAQGAAAGLMLIIGGLLLGGWNAAAWAVEAFLLLALGALMFGGFCMGAYMFHMISGQSAFARRTMPWSVTSPGEEVKPLHRH